MGSHFLFCFVRYWAGETSNHIMSTTKTAYPGMPSPLFPDTNPKPVMGFLYSVSRTSLGEYWPLYVGPNSIGRSPECGIRLEEASVYENHAVLVIRKMQNNGENAGIFVYLQDTGSMYGTMLNGVTLDFNPKECRSGDIISVGENYELYFLLVDPDSVGLKQKPGFRSTAPDAAEAGQPPLTGLFTQSPKGTMPGTVSSSPFEDGSKKTVFISPKR